MSIDLFNNNCSGLNISLEDMEFYISMRGIIIAAVAYGAIVYLRRWLKSRR